MGWNLFTSIGNFADGVATTAGHALGVLPKNKHVTGVSIDLSGLDKVPIIGAPLHSIFNLAGSAITGPFDIANKIIEGDNVGKVLTDHFKQDLKDVKNEAGLAQIVVSTVPGIGTGVSAALGAGLALASGRPIDEIAMAAIKGAVPGGPLAAAAYELGKGAIAGKAGSVGAAALDALGAAAGVPIPPEAKAALRAGLSTVQALSQGHGSLDDAKAADAKIAQGLAALPASKRKSVEAALKIGVAAQHAQNLQALVQHSASSPEVQEHLASMPQDEVAQAARSAVGPASAHGFDVGHGLVQHETTPNQVTSLRATLSTADKRGFDVAAALHIGRVAAPPLGGSAGAQAGYAVAQGVRAANPLHAATIKAAVSASPALRVGVKQAEKELMQDRLVGLVIDAGLVAGGAMIGASIGGPPGAIVGGLAGLVLDLVRMRG